MTLPIAQAPAMLTGAMKTLTDIATGKDPIESVKKALMGAIIGPAAAIVKDQAQQAMGGGTTAATTDIMKALNNTFNPAQGLQNITKMMDGAKELLDRMTSPTLAQKMQDNIDLVKIGMERIKDKADGQETPEENLRDAMHGAKKALTGIMDYMNNPNDKSYSQIKLGVGKMLGNLEEVIS